MMTKVLIVVVLPTTSPVVNTTRYDLTMPFRMEGGSQLTVIDVEFKLSAVTFSGEPGAMYAEKKIVLYLQWNLSYLGSLVPQLSIS